MRVCAVVHVIAKDKTDNGKAYHVEELPTYDAAKAVKEYVQQRVDPNQWAIDTSYTRMGMEPWNFGNLREKANVWEDEG